MYDPSSECSAADGGQLYRVWLVSRSPRWDGPWDAVPPHAQALAPAAEGAFPLPIALAFLQSYNTRLERRVDNLWAVVVPVRIRFEGDCVPGHFLQAARPASGEDDRS